MNQKNRMALFGILFIISIFVLFIWSSQKTSGHYDVLIQNAKIVDGTGEAAFQGDIAIKGEKIVAVGKIDGEADTVINGTGLVACPGFIDPHNHADFSIMQYPLAENLIMQGITTVMAGNCGQCPAPQKNQSLGQWLSKLEKKGIALNLAQLVGHSTVRTQVMGQDYKRKATPEEIEEMKKLVEAAMQDGAFGLSSFGDPSPGEFAQTEELIELAKVAQKYEGIYDPHTRGTQMQWSTDDPEEFSYAVIHAPLENAFIGRYRGYMEAVEIARKANIRLNIAHMSNAFWIPQPHPDYLEEAASKATLEEVIDKSRAEGLEVSFDIMTYDQNINTQRPLISEFFNPRLAYPDWLSKLKKEEFLEKLKTEEFRTKIRKIYDKGRMKFGMIHTKVDPYWMIRYKILKSAVSDYEDKTIAEIAEMRGTDALEAVFDILVEDPEAIGVPFWDPRMSPAAITTLIQHPYGMPCTDVWIWPAKLKGTMTPPPIAYGLYPNYIKTYVKEKGVLTLEEAIRKATSLPARVIGVEGRGTIKEGNYADILVFNYETISDKGDFMNPAQPPEGIEFVIVNGTIVYKEMAHTGAKPGHVLRHKAGGATP